MATYLQGVTDYIPQIQPFKPDLNFYNHVLQTKQAQYQQGYDRISGIYGSLLNSPIINKMTDERRNQYFKDAQNQIQKLSEVDLSLKDNVTTAMGVFQPLIDDKYVGSGITKTKRFQGESNKANYLRSSLDPKLQTQFWAEGLQDINNWAEDYSKASMEEAYQYVDPRYVPFKNLGEHATKFLKEANFDMVSSGPDGRGYIIKTTNGAPVVPLMSHMLMGTVGSDPAFLDMAKVEVRLARRNWINENLPKYNNDPMAAEDAYFTQAMAQSQAETDKTDKLLGIKHKQLDNKTKMITDAIAQKGTVPLDDSLVSLLKSLQNQKTILNNASQQVANARTAGDPQGMLAADRVAKRDRMETIVAHNRVNNKLSGLAYDWAMATKKVEMSGDPVYAMNAGFAHAEKMELMRESAAYKLAVAKGQIVQHTYEGFKSVDRADMTGGASAQVNELTADKDVLRNQRVDLTLSMKNVMRTLYTQLVAKSNDTNVDPATREDAREQLKNFFSKEVLDEAGYKLEGLSNSKTFANMTVMPNFANVKKVVNSTWFSEHYKEIKNSVNLNITSAEIEQKYKALNLHQEETRKNYKNVLTWLDSNDKELREELKGLFDDQGNQIFWGTNPSDKRWKTYHKLEEVIAKSNMVGGVPIWKSWEGGGNAGGRTAGVMGGDFHPNEMGDASITLMDTQRMVNQHNIVGTFVGTAPTSEARLSTYPS